MIFKTICEECGKEFIGDDGLTCCVEHELIDHLNVDCIFKERLEKVLQELDKKYKTKTTYNFDGITVYDDYCGNIDNISYYFSIDNDRIDNSNHNFQIDTYWGDNTKVIPTFDRIKEEVEIYYQEKGVYEGKVEYKDYYDGLFIDDYTVGGCYLKHIFKDLVGKKVKIEVINE
ncbi:TPA: hypothetical protein ACH354_002329 [Clostridium perfringens]